MVTRFVQNPDVAWRVIDGEAVLLAIETTTYYSLDPVGTFLWKRFEKGASRDEALAGLLAEYEIDETTGGKDLDELIGDLVSEKLLLEVAQPPEGKSPSAEAVRA